MKNQTQVLVIGDGVFGASILYHLNKLGYHDAIMLERSELAAGNDFDIRPFGARALNALRLKKKYGTWGREYRPLYGPVEVGLDRFVAYDKPADFIGKTTALAERDNGWTVELLGQNLKASLINEPLFDANASRMRS